MSRARSRGSKKPAGTDAVSSRIHWPGHPATLAACAMAMMPLASTMYVRFPPSKGRVRGCDANGWPGEFQGEIARLPAKRRRRTCWHGASGINMHRRNTTSSSQRPPNAPRPALIARKVHLPASRQSGTSSTCGFSKRVRRFLLRPYCALIAHAASDWSSRDTASVGATTIPLALCLATATLRWSTAWSHMP